MQWRARRAPATQWAWWRWRCLQRAAPTAGLPPAAADTAASTEHHQQQEQQQQQQQQQQSSTQQQQSSTTASERTATPALNPSAPANVQRLFDAAGKGAAAALTPECAAWIKQQEKNVAALQRAVDVLAAAPAQLAAAVEADEEALRAAIGEAPTEEVRTLLQQALNGVMQHGWVPPQAVLLMSQPNGIPPVRITPVLAGDAQVAQCVKVLGQAIRLCIQKQMLACSETRLQRDVDSLPSLEHVPPLAVASAAAATAPAVKPPPPSKQAKQALDEVWRTIIPCLEAAGQPDRGGCDGAVVQGAWGAGLPRGHQWACSM